MRRTGIDYYFICLLGVIAAVIAFKWQQLGLPYFWDEAWVYAPAVLEMHQNGLSLLPDAIPPGLTRGHPLLFHFMAAGWMKIFGTGFFAAHSFALLISVALLIAVYFFCKEFISPLAGLLAATMLAVQPLFLAQSSFLLPEVMMGLWTILSLHFFLKKKWILFIVFAACMLLTKESGIVLIFTIGLWTFFESVVLKKEPVFKAETLKIYALIASPLLISGIYFVIQKIQLGWFLYPEHLGLMSFQWTNFHNKFLDVYAFVFQGQGRYLLFISFFICVSFCWRSLNTFEKIFIPMGYLVTTYILFNTWGADDKISLVLVFILSARLFQLIFINIYNEDRPTGSLLSILSLFVFFYLIFTQLNFLSLRYLILLLPVIIITVLGLLYKMLEDKKWLFVLFAVISIVNCFRQINKYENVGDYDMSYADAVKAQQNFVRYAENNNWHDQKICAGFNSSVNLTQASAGYLHSDKKFAKVTDTLTSDIDICVFTNIEPRGDYDSLLNVINLEHLTSIEENKVWIDVYKFNGFVNDSTPHVAVPKREIKKR